MADQNALKEFESRMQQERARLGESTSAVDAFEARMRAEQEQLVNAGNALGGLSGIQEHVSLQRRERAAQAGEARRARLAGRQDAWTTMFGLTEDDALFNPVNLVAAIRNRAADMEGSALAAPFNAASALLEANVPDDARGAFQRSQEAPRVPRARVTEESQGTQQEGPMPALGGQEELLARAQAADAEYPGWAALVASDDFQQADLRARHDMRLRYFQEHVAGDLEGEERRAADQAHSRAVGSLAAGAPRRAGDDEDGGETGAWGSFWTQEREPRLSPKDEEALGRRELSSRPTIFQSMVRDGLIPGQDTDSYRGGESLLTNETRLLAGELTRRLAGAVKESRQVGEIVDPLKMGQFTEELAWRSDQGLKDLGAAMQSLEDGDLKFGVIDTVSALTNLAMQGGVALVMNPGATAQVVAEQAPQLALAAVSGGSYAAVMAAEGMDLLRQGVVNYQKAHDGALPPQEEFEYMATNAFAWTAAMAIGDTTLLNLMTPVMKPGEAVATGLVRSGMNVARHTAAGTGAETLAEGIQTYTEGEATYQPASGFDIYQGSVMGGGAGGAMSGSARVVHEVFGLTEERVHNQGVEQRIRGAHVSRALELAQGAAQSGDISTLVDPQSESYNPLAAVLALDLRLKNSELSDAERTQAMGQIGQVLEAAVAGVAQTEQALYQGTREYRQDLQRTLRDNKAEYAELTDKASEDAVFQKRVIDAMEAQLERVKRTSESDQRLTEQSAEMAKSDLEAIKRIHSRLVGEATAGTDVTSTVAQAVEGDRDAAQQVITLAMANPESVTLEQANALLETEVLAPNQREFLARFTEAQAAANQALGTQGVNMEVFQGSRETGSLGISQYRSGITAAVQAGDTETATRLMGLLDSFTTDHVSKNEAAWQAFRQVEGTNQRLAVVPQEDGTWQISETIPNKAERDASGAMVIHRNSNNKGTLTAIEAEAQALQAAQAEMQAAMGLAPTTAASNPAQQESSTVAPAVETGVGAAAETASTPQVEFVARYTPADVQAAPEKVFVFGDNMQGRGKAGQAVIRDEPNAIGIPTKWAPARTEPAYFGQRVEEEKAAITAAVDRIVAAREAGATIVMPKDGVGSGLAQLEQRAPEVWAHLQSELARAGLAPVQQEASVESSEPVNVWAGSNENAVLSNLAPRPFNDGDGREYQSVEHAYQSWKSGTFDQETYDKYQPGKSQKIAGRKGTKTDGNWNLQLMERMIEASFRQNPEAAQALLATGNRPITHTQDKGVWRDAFPQALMNVRARLQQESANEASKTGTSQGADAGPSTEDSQVIADFQALASAQQLSAEQRSALNDYNESAGAAAFDMTPEQSRIITEAARANPAQERVTLYRADREDASLVDRAGTDVRTLVPMTTSRDWANSWGGHFGDMQIQQVTIEPGTPMVVVSEGNTAEQEVLVLGTDVQVTETSRRRLTDAEREAMFPGEQNEVTIVEYTVSPRQAETPAQETVADETTVSSTDPVADATPEPSVTTTQQQASTESTAVVGAPVQPEVQPQSVDLLGDVVETQVAETKKKRGQGKVAAVKRAVSNVAGSVTQGNRAALNAITAGIRQGRQRKTAASEQPLVEVENFLSGISQLKGEEFAQRFLASEMTAEQANLVDLFTEYARQWQENFEGSLPPLRKDNTFYLEDFFQYLRDPVTGEVEQNVWTAMSAGMFGWLVEQGTRSPTNTEETIAAMLGNEMGSVPLSLQKRLASVGTREGLLVNRLGRQAVQALGAYALPGASRSSLAKLETALGNRMLALLEVEGLLYKTAISDAELQTLMGSEKSGDPMVQHYFYALSQAPDAQAQLTEIKEMAKGTQGVISNLFGMEQGVKAPGFKAAKYDQRAIKNTDRGVPKAMREILAKENKKAHYLRTDAVTLLEVLPEQLFLEIGGWTDSSARTLHSSNSEGVKGKNDSAERSLTQAKEFIELVRNEDPELKQPFFFNRNMWKPQRVGLEENLFNPQADKLHRLLTGMGGWQTEASLTNAEHMQDFWLAVGEGLGVKTDAQSNEKSVADAIALTQETVMVEGIEAIMRALNGEVAQDNDAALIKAAVKRGGEKFHSLDALIAVAHHHNAASNSQPSFTHTLTREVDGKTNGPMLAMLMLGAGKDSNGLLSRIAAGGFFGKDAGFTQVADWAQDPNNQDLYKATARSMVQLAQRAAQESPETAAMLQAVYEVTGALTSADGGVTSEGRSLVKTPITALMFGSGVKNVVDGMADDFLQALYDKVEDALNNEGERNVPEALALVNRFLPEHMQLDVSMAPEAATKELSKAQATAVKNAFKNSFGEVIEQTLKREFHTFIAIRDAVNNAANTAFQLYDLAFEYKREQKLKYLMANGQLPYEKVTRGGKVHYVPAMDLTAEQVQEIRDELKPMEPVIHSAWTKLSGDTRDNGIFLSKNGQQLSDDLAYMTTSKFAEGYFPADVQKTKTNYGMENSPMSPGVAAIILAIHSTDSYIASQAYSKLQALNVHDAEIVAAGDAKAVAKALNEATYEVMSQYSVSDEITQALERTATGFFEVFKDIDPKSELAGRYKKISNEAAKAHMRKELGDLDWDWYKAQPHDGVGLVLDYAVRASRHADKTRLSALSEMAAVDQYPMRGGNHVISAEEQQANAERATQAALRAPDEATMQASAEAKEQFTYTKAIEEVAAVSARKRDTQLALPEAEVQQLFDPAAAAPTPSTQSVLSLPEALVLDLIERAQVDGNDVVYALSQALDQQTGFNLEQALATLPEIEAAQALSALQAEADRTGIQSIWGEVGPARIPSDPRWADFFTKAGDQVSVGLVARHALRMLEQMPKGRTSQFYREILVQVARAIPADVTVTMVTPNHAAADVGAAPVSNARGWYTTEGMKGGRIFLKSPSFADSGLTTETVIHELIHAAVALQIANPTNSEVAALVGNLETLLERARAHAVEKGLTGFEDALSSVQELVAWGMTNLRFQQEVLNQISVPAPKGNSLVTGMRQFLETIRGILFRGSKKSEAEQQINGLSVLVANVSGVMAQAQKGREATQQQRELTLAQANTVAEMSSLEILEALPGTQDPVLDHLLANVVEKIHGPFGAWFAQVAQNRPLGPLEVYTRAMNEKFMPFSSATLSRGFQLSEKQSFVLEHVELVMRETLDSDPVAYKELAKVWKEASQKITPEDFLEGDWNLAAPESRAEAVAKHGFIFRIQANSSKGMTNHLSRFAALAMVHPGLREKLQFTTDRPGTMNPQARLGDMLKSVWDHVVDTAHGFTLGVRGGDLAGTRIEGLMMHLVDAATRRQELLAKGRAGILDSISELTDGLNLQVSEKVEQVAQLPFLQNNRFAAVRAAAAVAETTAAGRLDHLTAAIKQGNNEMGKVREGVLASAVTEVQGAWDKATKVAQMLLRETKRLENMRLGMIDNTRANVMAAFKQSGEYLTKSTKAALTQVTLRTDMDSLLDRFTVAELDAILADPSSYAATLEAELTALGGPHLNFYLASAKALGYQMAWGVAPAENMMLNAHNIAHLGGTQYTGKVNAAKADAARAILDPLITLYALQYSDGNQLAEVREVIRVENQRQDGNGIEFILGLHRAMKQEALEALFHDSPTLMQKGYTPEIYNPNITLEVANEARAAQLEALGYTTVLALPRDRTDPRAEQQYLMRIKDGGQARKVTGTLSVTGERAQGTTVHAGLSKAGYTGVFKKNAQMTAEIRAKNSKSYERLSALGSRFDPRKEANKGPFYVPVVNEQGEIVNYRYMMSEQNKDNLLERDNAIEDVLGMLVGQTADKQTSKEHNKTIIQALKDQYDAEYQDKPHSYVRVAPDSTDPELKQHWDLLPEDTKQAAIQVWGRAEILVRTDLVNINFGYHKLRFSNAFKKDAEERNVVEQIFVGSMQAVFGEKAYLRMRQASMGAEGLVTAIKDNVVIKNLTTLWFNVISNVTVLWWQGVPMADMARLHKEGIQGAMDYQRDRNELTQLQQMLDAGYVQGRATEIEQRVLELQDAIARNPVKELIDAGLMPTIVEDVDVHQNQFSPFKSFMEEKAQPYLDMVPASLMGVAKTLYMTHDTPAYKALSKSTQLSDFVARYTLYQYLTQRKRNPLSKVDAIQQASDMFVNYDIPTSPQMQYLNDKGLLMFTKYYMRIQRAIYHLYREHPGRAIALKMLSMAMGDLSTIQDSWFTQQLTRNPLRSGPVQMLDAWDEPIMLKTALSPFR